MTETPPPASEAPQKGRRWFVVLAIVTLIGFALFVGIITVCAVRIPELKRARYGVLEGRMGARPA